MKEIDIKNNLLRRIVARKTEKGLVKGQVYTLQSIVVGSWRTDVYIKETDKSFYSSEEFAEDENSPLMRAFSRIKDGNKAYLLARMHEPKDVKLRIGKVVCLTLQKHLFEKMDVFDVLTIGRGDCSISRWDEMDMAFDYSVSKLHLIIYREADNCWRIIDCSTFGTEIIL